MKRKLLQGHNVLGCWTSFGSPQIAELLAMTGFDFLLFDQEHGLGDSTSLVALLQAIAPTATSSVVRIPSNDPVYLKRVLDAGVEGVMIPQVETAAEAKAAVDACRYPPRGRRGSSIGSCRASNYGIAAGEYRKTADDEVLIIAQIESVKAVENIDAIVHPMSHIPPSYYGIFEDNDPSQRLMVVANFDNDVPEYWEWSGQGLFPFDTSNEAYKLGVNYMIYGLMH